MTAIIYRDGEGGTISGVDDLGRPFRAKITPAGLLNLARDAIQALAELRTLEDTNGTVRVAATPDRSIVSESTQKGLVGAYDE